MAQWASAETALLGLCVEQATWAGRIGADPTALAQELRVAGTDRVRTMDIGHRGQSIGDPLHHLWFINGVEIGCIGAKVRDLPLYAGQNGPDVSPSHWHGARHELACLLCREADQSGNVPCCSQHGRHVGDIAFSAAGVGPVVVEVQDPHGLMDSSHASVSSAIRSNVKRSSTVLRPAAANRAHSSGSRRSRRMQLASRAASSGG